MLEFMHTPWSNIILNNFLIYGKENPGENMCCFAKIGAED